MLRRFHLACIMATGVVFVPIELFAFPSSRLVYTRGEGAESCPDERSVREAVATRLGYDPFFATADKTILAQISLRRGGLAGEVQLVDAEGIVNGRREFKTPADQCSELLAAMALAISIAIDPASESRTPASAAPQPKQAPNEATTRALGEAPEVATLTQNPLARERAETAPPPSPALELEPGLFATSSFGTAPSLAMGLGLFVGARRGAFSLILEGRRDWPAASALPFGGRVSTSLWVGSVVPCIHAQALLVCAVGSVGSLYGEGTELATPRSGNGLYVAAGARTGLEIALPGTLFFRPEVDLMATLKRNELLVDGATAWTASPFSALLGVGLGAHFP